MEMCKWCSGIIAPGEEHKCDKAPPLAEQFDLAAGRHLKESSKDRVAREDFTAHMRMVAQYHALKHGTVTIDDLRRHALKHGIVAHHPGAWGAIFRGKEWEAVGHTQTKKVTSHAREIKVWRYTVPQQLK